MEDVYHYTRSPAWEELVSGDFFLSFHRDPAQLHTQKQADSAAARSCVPRSDHV